MAALRARGRAGGGNRGPAPGTAPSARAQPRTRMNQPVVGFRRWAVTYHGATYEPRLRGRVAPVVWSVDGWTEAACVASMAASDVEAHAAPHRDCDCGLYAYHSLPRALARIHAEARLLGRGWDNSEERDVVGAVIGAGRVVVHGVGWRAQYARPVVLARPEVPFP